MSDSDRSNPLGDLGDLDWDSALDEWEKKTFSASIAPEKDTTTEIPRGPMKASPVGSLENAGAVGTVIAPVPRELSEPPPAPSHAPVVPRLPKPPSLPETAPISGPGSSVPPPPGQARRGGLSQLFAKKESPRSIPAAPPRPLPVPPRRPPPPVPVEPTTREVAASADSEAAPTLVRDVHEGRKAPLADADTISQNERPPPGGAAPLDDADTETVIADRKRTPSISDAETETKLPSDDAPTVGRGSRTSFPETARASFTETARTPSSPPAPLQFEAERPVSRWLDEGATAEFQKRIAWLLDEARALADPTDRARSLLTTSELLALVGDRERALALATEARDLAPALALAWRQARQLLPRDPRALASALDAEAAHSKAPAARAHATLLAADVLRTNMQGDAAIVRWDSACKLDPADVRAHTARAAIALAQGNHTSRTLNLAEISELAPIDKAIANALRARGIERPGADPDRFPVNDGLRYAREAITEKQLVVAAQAFLRMAKVPGLAKGATWISAAFGALHIAGRRAAARCLKNLVTDGEGLARRQLAARGIELADPELCTFALSEEGPFAAVERACILALAGQDTSKATSSLDESLAPLVDALAAASTEAGAASTAERLRRTSGSPENRALSRIGRLLATRPAPEALDAAIADAPTLSSATAAGVSLEAAVRGRRFAEVAAALSSLPTEDGETTAQKHVAAAIIAERARDADAAGRAWREALAAGAKLPGVLRAAASVDPDLDVAAELLRMADEMPDGPTSAVLRLEALTRRDGIGDDERVALLERIHRAAPSLGIASFLAERVARRQGDLDEVLRWIGERRAFVTDPLEAALDAVREALLVADRDADLANSRLEEAHRARPDDVALRELYERLATEPPEDRASWREKRAEKAGGPARARLYTQAALEYERMGDDAAALRAARLAIEAGDTALAKLVAERAEGATNQATGQTEALLETVRSDKTDPKTRRDALARLAALDEATSASSSLEWHRLILEDDPKCLPSLRRLEHTLIGERRDDELAGVFEQVARALDGSGGGEATGHAQHAARFLARQAFAAGETSSDATRALAAMAHLAADQPGPSLWGLRVMDAHARLEKNDEAHLKATLALLERTQRPSERAALLLRASEAAARLDRVADARVHLEQAANEDPGDVVTWGFLAEIREHGGETRAAAEACESLARTSAVPEHQILAWYDAARIWLDEVNDVERGMTALEQAAAIDVTHADVFDRLSNLYATRGLDAELAGLLETRLATVDDPDERVTLQVELARAFADMGDVAKARGALDGALSARPDHTSALGALAELCVKEADWNAAEQAFVRLARLFTSPADQKRIYGRLGDIYAEHLNNLSRAEVAYKEVLKRAANDPETLQKLVVLYTRQGDVPSAVEAQQKLAAETSDAGLRLERLVALAEIYETVGRDLRRAEQALEAARREFPTSVVALRALAEFYKRQHQLPAMQILLDRAAADARRSFAAGRFVAALFEVLHAAFELRGKRDAARVVAATLAAVEGQSADLPGADARALDPRLDDILAPELISAPLRTLFAHAGDTLDAVTAVDVRAMRAQPLPYGTPLATTIGGIATVIGLGALQVLVSPQLAREAVPLATSPPSLLVGEPLLSATNEGAQAFVVARALKMLVGHCSALLRGTEQDVGNAVAALFTAFNPSFVAQGVDARRVQDLSRRLQGTLPRNLDPTVGVIALEAAGMVGAQSSALGRAASAWANRVALLVVGDPNAALEAIAWASGQDSVPTGSEERAAWIAKNASARELMTFSVTDAYAEARARLGLER